jgi:hypothetical protein
MANTKQPVVKPAKAKRAAARATKTKAQLDKEDKQRASKATIEKRVEAIVTAILEGRRSPSIIATAMQQYKVGEPQAYKYYHAALKRIRASFDEQLPDYIKAHLARLEHIYKIAMERNELKPALAAMKQISDLLGLDAPKEIKSTMGFEGLNEASDDQLKRIVTAGLAAAGSGSNAANRKTRG